MTNVAVQRPTLSATVSGTNITLNVTNGSANAPAWLLLGTNPAQLMSTWAPVYSNLLDGSGHLSLTTNLDKTQKLRLYRVQMP